MKLRLSFLLPVILIILCAVPATAFPQKSRPGQSSRPAKYSSRQITGSPARQFTLLWKQVDSLANLGQPRSALEIVDKIYSQAKAAKNDPQVIRAIIYRIRLNADFRENFLSVTITGLKKEIAASAQPAKQVLQSILAEVYWKYYQVNQYRFRDRTRVISNTPDSLETWDLATISAAITRTYLLSLQDADTLQHTPIGLYDDILSTEVFDESKHDTLTAEVAKFVPTLYDFLAGRALDYFTTAEPGPGLNAQHFEVDRPWYFDQPAGFAMNRTEISADTAVPASFAMRIFRDASSFHLNDSDPRALIDAELRRFDFVHDKYVLPGKDSLYIDALKKFEQANISSPWSSSVSYALATFLGSQGQLYQPLISARHKWDIRSAVEVCDKAIQRFPGSEGSKNCKILARSLREPSLQVTTETAVIPGKPSLALAGVKNLKQLFFRLVMADPEIYQDKTSALERKEIFAYLVSLPVTKSWSQDFPDDSDFQKHQAEIAVPEVPAGFWLLLCSRDREFSDFGHVFAVTPFWSTRISYVSKRNDDGSFAWFLPDRETGQPLKNATAEVWEKNWEYRERKYTTVKIGTFSSGDEGYFEVEKSENDRRGSNQFLKIRWKNDFMITDNFYQYPVHKGMEQTVIQTMFFTDRAIYRPGQIVYFKGIILERTGDRSKIKTNYAVKVMFTDVNGQKIAGQTFTSNAFGSFNGSFVAPAGVLPGQMTISSESGSISISVEEYKRPTFDVACEPLEGNYKLGELLKLTGKAMAFAGNPVDGGQVKYRVVRNARYPFRDRGWWWPMPVSPEVEITSGTTTTDGEGKFIIPFKAIPDLNVDPSVSPVFDFTVSVDVTDINGETQSAEQSVSAGYKALIIGSDIPETVNLSRDTLVKISATNLNGRPTPVSVTITLEKLRQPGHAYKVRSWERPDLHIMTEEEFHARFPYDLYDNEDDPATWAGEGKVFEKTIATSADSTFRLNDPASFVLQPGSYLLVLKAADPFGQPVEVKKYVTVFSPASREVPVNKISWFVPLKTSGEPGEAARFIIGSKEDNVNLVYEIRVKDSLVSRETIRINNRAMVLEIPITERYRGNFGVNFLFVRHNRVFQNSRVVSVPYANKKLEIVFESFRSKLGPGAKERWKIKIAGPDGKAASAEFLAGMYDASLDQFRANEWNFNVYRRYSGINAWDADNSFRTSSGQYYQPDQPGENYRFHPGLRLNWFGTGYFSGQPRYYRRSGGPRDKSMPMQVMDTAPTATGQPSGTIPPPMEMKETAADSANRAGTGKHQAKTSPEPVMQVRRDFRETAFFYPALETDSSGRLVLEFTAPESLTKWKLLGLAHTKNLEYGLVEKELVTRKDLMVFPNAPRFVRQGDTVVFKTRIVNLSDHDLSGQVTLTLADAITLQPLDNLVDISRNAGREGTREQSFTVKKGQSAAASWRLIIPESSGLSVLQYRVTAVAGGFSDGEEKAIPVLTNRMLVTESLPLPVRGKGTFDFSFGKLLQSASAGSKDASLKNYRLTLEFASNPAWYAIQALPLLNNSRYDNADAVFAAFWSNSVAAYIANSNPKIRTVFESWKNLTPGALQSNLSKNQELKSALLQETPWVMEAANETDGKQKLGLFFDPGNLGSNLRGNLLKLQKLQKPNGGWTWFEGMPENRYITQNILKGLGQLYHLGITDIMKDPSSREMVLNAIRFLDGELLKDYRDMKKYHGKDPSGNHLGSPQIQYLYARSLFMADPLQIQDPGPEFMEAFNYYKTQAEKYWLQNDRYLQGMIALALNRLGSTEAPSLILKSLSEKALHSDEMGMYWAGERGYYWYQAPIESQAMMIEAFDEIAKDEKTVEDLKIWLLKQKQTQDWRSPRATLEACYALLLRGTDLLSDEPGVKITLGKEKISSDKLIDVTKEAGTGYFQVSWTGNEINPEMGKITVSKSGPGVAWGAVYWQYFEDLDRITPASTPMKLEKKLFVERNTLAGPVLEPVTNDELRMTNDTIKSDSSDRPHARLLKIGDKLKVRIVLTVDRDLEFVHMKDMRASGLEPVSPASNDLYVKGGGFGEGLSGYRYQEGLGYYQSTTDQATNFFFDYLPKGTYVFGYGLKVNAKGKYSNGITTIQCMYAPEFSAHSGGIRIDVR